MKTTELGAAMQLRKYLARVEQAVGIECAFQALLMRQVAFVTHRPHQVALFDANPVLASQNPADRDTEPAEDICAKGLGTLDLVGLVGVVKNQRVKIAVASVKYVRDGKPVLLRERSHPGEDFGQARAGNRAVHAIIIRRDPPDSGEGCLAAGPEGQPLRLVTAEPDRGGAVDASKRLDLFDQMIDFAGAPSSSSTISSASDIERVADL